MTVEADRPFVPQPNPHGLDSEDWDERLSDLHFRDVAEYAVGYNVSTSVEVEDGKCRRVRTEWMPQGLVQPTQPAEIPGVEFGMEALGSMQDAATAKRLLDPLVDEYRKWNYHRRTKSKLRRPQRTSPRNCRRTHTGG